MNQQIISNLTSDEALQRLIEGNKRYVSARLTHPNQTSQRRKELLIGQHPFAVILGCSDSRVPPEIIFDQGLGDLFVIRVAGNVLDDIVLGSIEYAVEHLHTPLVMVLGHSQCGAITATIAGKELKGYLPLIAAAIQSAVNASKSLAGDPVENAVHANALSVAAQLRCSKPILAQFVNNGNLKIVATKYDLETGNVELLT